MPSKSPSPAQVDFTWKIERVARQVNRLVVAPSGSGTSWWSLHLSDVHWDSPYCDRKSLKRHCEQAMERGAPIFIYGDLYDLMQGKYDKRSRKSELRRDLLTAMLDVDDEDDALEYLDVVVNESVKWFMPYASNIALVCPGNHETAINQKHETDVIQSFVDKLRDAGSPALKGSYWGYVLLFTELCHKTDTRIAHYHHGYGGGGEVTRGMIDNNRTRGQYDADFYFSGHIHRRNNDENVITRVDKRSGKIERTTQEFCRISGYKDETINWHAEKGRASRPIGGWWLECEVKLPHKSPLETYWTPIKTN